MSHVDENSGSRRDFLYHATAGTGAITIGAAVWPLVNQMNATADVRAMSSILVDVSGIEVGTQITVKWRGKPVFIRRRTAEDIERGRNTPLEDLPDQMSRNIAKPEADASDENRTLDDAGEWLVMMGVCTHLGCVPLGGNSGDYEGWFCPCHGSHYDIAGRIRKGPAPENLPIPENTFFDDSTIKLG